MFEFVQFFCKLRVNQTLIEDGTDAQGFGFIDMGGVTVFVHHSQCEEGKQPKVGDVLTFTTEQRTGFSKFPKSTQTWLRLLSPACFCSAVG